MRDWPLTPPGVPPRLRAGLGRIGNGDGHMRYPWLAASLFAFSVASHSAQAAAQDFAAQIVDVWRLASLTEKDLATGVTTPFQNAEHQGYRIFTRGGHAFAISVYSPRKAPSAGNIV